MTNLESKDKTTTLLSFFHSQYFSDKRGIYTNWDWIWYVIYLHDLAEQNLNNSEMSCFQGEIVDQCFEHG